MITDDEVMRLFERADPARTTDDLDNTPDTTGYLAAHPDVHAQITWIEVGEHRIPSADEQALAGQFSDEFVAQSDVYPVGR